jgi:hypothetical protein
MLWNQQKSSKRLPMGGSEPTHQVNQERQLHERIETYRYKTRGERGEGKTLQEAISGSSADTGAMMIRRIYLQIPRACGGIVWQRRRGDQEENWRRRARRGEVRPPGTETQARRGVDPEPTRGSQSRCFFSFFLNFLQCNLRGC